MQIKTSPLTLAAWKFTASTRDELGTFKMSLSNSGAKNEPAHATAKLAALGFGKRPIVRQSTLVMTQELDAAPKERAIQ